MERQEAGYTVADEPPSGGITASFPPWPTAARDTIALVKRSLAWLGGIVGIAALGRLLSRRKATAAPAMPPVPAERVHEEAAVDPEADPAEELRRKLAAQRQPETQAEPEAVETLDERRARVHAKAREAMDSMNDEGTVA